MTTVHSGASLGEGLQTWQLRAQKGKVRKTINLTILFFKALTSIE